VEVAPHCLLQAVLRRALASNCTVVGLMDKRQPDNHIQLLNSLGRYVCFAISVTYNMLLDSKWYFGSTAQPYNVVVIAYLVHLQFYNRLAN